MNKMFYVNGGIIVGGILNIIVYPTVAIPFSIGLITAACIMCIGLFWEDCEAWK